MPPRTPYEIFGLPAKFRLDEALLRERYEKLRTQFHPDRFAAATPAERRAAEGMAADVNEAWRLLSDPLARAAWLLTQRGCNPFAEVSVAMSPEFLERQMELRERLEELKNKHWSDIKNFAEELDMDIKSKLDALEMLLDTQQEKVDDAADIARELKYFKQCADQAWAMVKEAS